MSRGRPKKERVVAMITALPESKIYPINHVVVTHCPIRNKDMRKLQDIMNSSFQDITF